MYLSNAIVRWLTPRFVWTMTNRTCKKRHSNKGMLSDGHMIMKSWKQRAGTQRRLICCWIKRSLRTTLPLAVVAVCNQECFNGKFWITVFFFMSKMGKGVINLTLRCHSAFHARGRPNMRETRHALKRARWWSLNSTSIEQPSSNFSLFVLFIIKIHFWSAVIASTCFRDKIPLPTEPHLMVAMAGIEIEIQGGPTAEM